MKAFLREKYRYVAFRLVSEKEFERKEFEKALNLEFAKILGETGYSKVAPKLISFNGKNGIIRTTAMAIDDLLVACSLMTKISGVPSHLVTTSISGTINKLKKRARA